MATLSEAVAALERHVGFPSSRARQVAQRLQQAGLIPHGAPGVAPIVDIEHVINLIIAIAADTTLHAAADAVRIYRAMTPGGACLYEAPPQVRTSAGEDLELFAEIAVRGDSAVVRRDFIEVVASWPEIVISDAGKAINYRQQGSLASHWGERGHRRSTTLSGAAVIDCLRELFGAKNA